jgi:hypothetical protein
VNKVILGCDPDSSKIAIAWYKNGELLSIQSMGLIELWKFLEQRKADSINTGTLELHIENLVGNRSSAFNHRAGQSAAVKQKISESVGKCKQVQIEIERIAESVGVKVVHHKVSSKWKDKAGKKEFERSTGWDKRSNEDTRSAAYFGFLGCK